MDNARRSGSLLGLTLLLFLCVIAGLRAANAKEDRWYVYQDAGATGVNHGIWSNYMPENGGKMVVLEEANPEQPYAGSTSLMVGVRFQYPWWCGIVVMSAPHAWGTQPETPAFDLSRATKLVFHARGDKGGEQIQVKVGIAGGNTYGDAAPLPFDTGWIRLSKDWQRYELAVDGASLERVITPFVLITNRAHNPNGRLLIYLDEIYFTMGDEPAANPRAAAPAPAAFPFLQYLTTAKPAPALVAFNPSGFDPRRPPSGLPYPEAEVRGDLASLRPAFDGLVLYSYRADVTPGILKAAADLAYRAVLLGLWDPKDKAEIAGVARLIEAYHDKLVLGLIVGNEGIIDNRYTYDDLDAAVRRLAALSPASEQVPLATSEPSGDYGFERLRRFGAFLAPNIHPAIDQTALDPGAAARWVIHQAATLARVAGKPVLVKETGMPGGGGDWFTPERQRDFWQAYLDGGRLIPVSATWVSLAAAFEAFDVTWKAEKTETPFEGHWGLLSPDRQPYPAFEVWRLRK
jgi:exo-beta-1,3-glucanase (GH17 family)